MDTTQNIISFCTGYGGIELGLELAGVNVRTVAACEIETYAIANLVEKMESGALEPFPIWTDLKTFDSRPFRGKIHGITGGYPCQPFSHAGQRKGTEDPRHLWPYICKHIDTIRPVWCFFENVSGHLTLGFDEVYKSLRGLGYSVEAGLFTASEVGAPHKRQRLFILAVASGARAGCFGGQARGGSGQEVLRQEDGQAGTSGIATAGELAHPNSQPNGQNPRGSEYGSQLADTGGIHTERANQDGTDGERVCELPRRNEVRSEDSGCGKGYGGEELADTDIRQSRPTTIAKPTKAKQPESGDDSRKGSQLADTESGRLQGCGCKRGDDTERWQEPVGPATQCGSAWPARPGQPQYDWEEPRTIESSLGRTANGTATRVDRLRLLGNGVVRQCAAKAWIELWNKIHGRTA